MLEEYSNVKIISIEGNIGSGKSTFVEYCKNNLPEINNYKIVFVDEPVNLWEKIKDKNGKNIIQNFYENQEKYAFPFQIIAFISRLMYLKNKINDSINELTEPNKKICVITERSIYTDCFVFAEMLKNTGKMNDICHEIYLQMFNEFSKDFSLNSVIYINATPEKCYERINKRNRHGEENISLDYLFECHQMHEEYISVKINSKYCNKFILDGMFDIEENPEIKDEWIQILKYCIEKCN